LQQNSYPDSPGIDCQTPTAALTTTWTQSTSGGRGRCKRNSVIWNAGVTVDITHTQQEQCTCNLHLINNLSSLKLFLCVTDSPTSSKAHPFFNLNVTFLPIASYL